MHLDLLGGRLDQYVRFHGSLGKSREQERRPALAEELPVGVIFPSADGRLRANSNACADYPSPFSRRQGLHQLERRARTCKTNGFGEARDVAECERGAGLPPFLKLAGLRLFLWGIIYPRRWSSPTQMSRALGLITPT